ncbi:phage baseplate assembly protein V [Neorhizobium sp. T786]|uniref:phage baseplate assembly protein V n=1 Tax=Pseudorhizobium xiangyangii TaxID=2883104 RepID=UPI001CFFF514|nr:phage baseplate assembly protein V [Neorhizobium xiangyangii]MCB5204253.1 phage baseplate assembly protein V [Neorhizobium xiangyangii]
MIDPTSRELRRLYARAERADRRIAMMNLSGKVVAKDSDKRRVRLKLGTSSDGRDVLSPWVRWQEAGAGGLKIHSEPAEGEQMMLVSASGTVGGGSIAIPSTYDQDNEAPSKSSDSAVFERGGRIELVPNGIRLVGTEIEFVGNVRATGGDFEHEGTNVGHDHKHTEVFRGSQLSGPPEE